MSVKAQNNEIRFRVIAYNAARMVNLAYSLVRGFLLSRRHHLQIINGSLSDLRVNAP